MRKMISFLSSGSLCVASWLSSSPPAQILARLSSGPISEANISLGNRDSGILCGLLLLAIGQLLPSPSLAGETPSIRQELPTTISPGWTGVYSQLPDPTLVPPRPGPDDIAGWKKAYDAAERINAVDLKQIEKLYGVTVSLTVLGKIPVLDIRPAGWSTKDRRVLIYTHGGAYTMYSANSTLPTSALAAAGTGLRVISVDYTTAPNARWQKILDQVISVLRAVLDQGHSMQDIVLFGDSAGGGLAAGTVLRMRDTGLGMPAALVLWSPWADITETGDSYITLKNAEPAYLYERVLGPSANAYANPGDQKNPYVSPVYGDFAKGFPPTLIQGGTREIFLSNFVRLYQAIEASGGVAKLDLYEGMLHVFQPRLPRSRESETAMAKMKAWLLKYLR